MGTLGGKGLTSYKKYYSCTFFLQYLHCAPLTRMLRGHTCASRTTYTIYIYNIYIYNMYMHLCVNN